MRKTIFATTLVALFLCAQAAQAMEQKKMRLSIDCYTQHAYRQIVVPEGKKAARFQANYATGQECGRKPAVDNPKTDVDEAEEWQKKWDNRTPPPYGWGVKGPTGYFYRVFHQFRVRSDTHGNLGTLWLGPGKYTVELRGYREGSTLELSYWLEPYTPEGAKAPAAAAPAAAAPAAVGTVEKPHAPGAAAPAVKVQQKVGPGIWGGVWYTHPGTITLTQSGNHVSGTYTLQSGKISGHIVGNTLVGKWSDAPTYKPPMDAGKAIYKMAADGKSFTVDFKGGYQDNDGLPWFRNAWKATRTP